MAKRKNISKSVRFEVFKRDNFTCQYCGRSAPEVILEVDHIIPVAKGGNNDILNLITSCRECNRGKSAKELSDNTVIKKQKAQLDELNEKREQMEMMVKWKQTLTELVEKQIDAVDDYIQSITDYQLSESGRKRVRKWIHAFGFAEVYTAAEISFDKYYSETRESSWQKAFDKIGGICYNRRKQRNENGD